MAALFLLVSCEVRFMTPVQRHTLSLEIGAENAGKARRNDSGELFEDDTSF